MKAISLFASAGIGDLALHKHGIEVLVANELLAARADLYHANFPTTQLVVGDIWQKKDEIIERTLAQLKEEDLDFVFATPPCQGMSKNGQGKLLRGIREGKKPTLDERNRLIIPTMEIVRALRPVTVLFENVPEMLNTYIEDEAGQLVNIIAYIERELGDDYMGKAEVVQFADYGIPQRRLRLITVYTRDPIFKHHLQQVGHLLPPPSHSRYPHFSLKAWVTVRDALKHLPPLDGRDAFSAYSPIPFHRVPVLDPKKYVWIAHTPPEGGAFDNQCANSACGYAGNPSHGSNRDHDGINRVNSETPLYCLKCGSLLPRPYTIQTDGTKRIMTGYTSAYKRMRWDLPAPTLTTNLSYPSSDHKLHPEQNRVLSLYEAFLLHTLDQFTYHWKTGQPAKAVPDTLICEVIGESIPPMMLFQLIDHLLHIKEGVQIALAPVQLRLIG